VEIQEHLRRAASFEASARKLDPIADTELYVVYLMRAGTSRVNAALHALGITDVQSSATRIGDLNHTYKPPLPAETPAEVKAMFEPLAFIENLRPEYVRGPSKLTPELVQSCSRAHEEVVARSTAIIERLKERAA
jgi:hypothetical protein